MLSHSTRVRGLKYDPAHVHAPADLVALYTSAWIEISFLYAVMSNPM